MLARRRLRAVIGSALLLAAVAARADDEPPAGAVLLPEVEVTAEPPSEAEQKAPTAFVSEVDVGSRNRALDTTADALEQAAGVQVQRYGGLGAFSTISIRGSSANQVPVYLDGVPLSQAQDQTVDLSTLPLDSLERIDVYRGTIPVGFGGGGIGGVVNLVTKPPSATPASELQVGYGSFETRKLVASHTQQLGGFDLLGHVTYLGSTGDFTYANDNGTPENPTDDRETTRINNQFDAVGGLLRVARDVGDGLRLDGTQELFYRTQGVPGPATVQFSEPSLDELRSLTYLRLSATGLADTVDTSGTLYGVYSFQNFFSPPQDFGPYDTHNQTAVVGGSNTGTWFAPWQQSVSWFDEIAYEQFFPYNGAVSPANGPDQTRLRLTLAAQDEVRLFDERLLLVPSARYEHLLDDFSGVDLANQPDSPAATTNRDLVSPSFGALVRLASWASLRGNVGYFQRAPNFAELFGNSGTVLGNAELKTEKGVNADVGATASWGAWRWFDRALLELAFFNTDYDDLIAFEAVNPEQFRPENIGKARVRGVELTAAGAALHHLGLQLNYTHQESEDRSGDFTDGNQLPLRPDDELFVRLEAFLPWARSYYEYTFISSDPTTVGNFITVPSRSIHTVGASLQPYPWMTIACQAANITNADIRDLGDFPLPGLTLFGSITVTL
jgi:iron complex outermembrane receptor protein